MFELTQYVWLIWSFFLLIIWAVLYLSLKDRDSKKKMFRVSLATSLLGLTEPVFVPEYWSPPSLFDLAVMTGFDIESLLFSFGVGGIAVVVYDYFFKVGYEEIPEAVQRQARHRFHYVALLSGPVMFAMLYALTDLNPIYSAIIALTIGGFAAWFCRPDLKV